MISSSGCDIYYYYSNLYNNPQHTVSFHNGPIQGWKGLDFTTSQDNAGVYEAYGYGLYKITTSESDAHFYIDYRDYRIGCSPYGNIGHAIDLWIKYNATTNTFSYSNQGLVLPFYTISNSQLISFYQLKNAGVQQTSKFPDYWSNCLVLIPSQTGNHPKLVWGPYPESVDVANYRVYRKTSNGIFNLIHTTQNENVFDYIDEEYCISNGIGQSLSYYVKAVFSNEQISNPTNTVFTQAVSVEKQNAVISKPSDFSLSSNFPNPFNPSTKISYSIKEEGLVTLKVYDVLGKEIATLVNENKPEGIYEAEFNASSLPSGMYIYKIQAGQFSDVKKMLLTK